MKNVMKMTAVVIAAALPAVFLGPPVSAAEPAKEERKLEGDELAKFYLQQIMDQADDQPAEVQARDLMQELKSLVERLDGVHRERLAKQKAEAEKRAAEQLVRQKAAEQLAKQKAEAEKLAAEVLGKRDAELAARAAPDGLAPSPAADHVVTLKPVVSQGAEGPKMPVVPEIPAPVGPAQDETSAAKPVVEPAASAPVAEQPAAEVREPPVAKPAPAVGTEPTVPPPAPATSGAANAAATGDAGIVPADSLPALQQQTLSGLVAALDHVIARLQTLRDWLMTVPQAS